MAILLPDNWPKLMEPGLREVWQNTKDGLTDYIPKFYGVHDTDRLVEHDYDIGSLGRLQKLSDVGQVPYGTFEKGFEKQYRQEEYVGGVTVPRLMAQTEQYGVIDDLVKKEALMTHTTLQEYAASPFNNAFSTGAYAGPDGAALCSTAHKLNDVGTADKVNFEALALSSDNLFTVRRKMRKFVDDQGHLIGCNPNLLIVPPELEETAYVITNSNLKSGTADNDANFMKGKFDVVVWDYLTDANAWFVADSKLMKLWLKWFWLQRPEFKSETDFDTLIAKYRVYTAFVNGFSKWQWVYGCNPS